MHGDLWRGNLLRRRAAGARAAARRAPWPERLVVIDWAGAQPRGVPFFDLVRAGESLGVSPRRLRVELLRHCALLGCEPADAAGYVLAAAGGILGDLGEFPVHRLLGMADSSLARVDAALGPLPAGSPSPAR